MDEIRRPKSLDPKPSADQVEAVPPKERTVARERLSKIRRHWLTVAFLLGFLVDNITLNRVDELLDNVILATYVILSMTSILVLYASVSNKLPERVADYGRQYAPLVVQYAFGGLLSGMLIFYGRSGDLLASWPFLAIILVAILGNELIKDRSTRLIYNLGILFVGLMSYVVLVVPVLSGYMGPFPFIISGLIALTAMYWFTQFLYRIIPRFMDLQMRAIILTIGSIYIGFNFLYFTNIIPPIPLSLKELGVYHSVVRFENNTYQLKWIDAPWWQPFTDSDKVFYPQQSQNVFCFASVFAPTKLNTEIYHVWEYQNEAGDWVEHARVDYAIYGGADGGYRGYTLIQNHREGKWRCSVETERGQVLGRETFTVAARQAEPPAPLVSHTQ